MNKWQCSECGKREGKKYKLVEGHWTYIEELGREGIVCPEGHILFAPMFAYSAKT